MAVLEIVRRRTSEVSDIVLSFKSSKHGFELLKSKFMDLSHEEFYVVFLDKGNQFLRYEQLSIGGMSGTLADGKIILGKR